MNFFPQVPGLRHVISQAATGYLDSGAGQMQPHSQGQVYHDQHHLHHQVRYNTALLCQLFILLKT